MKEAPRLVSYDSNSTNNTTNSEPDNLASSTESFNLIGQQFTNFFKKRRDLIKQVLEQSYDIQQKFMEFKREVGRFHSDNIPLVPHRSNPSKSDLLELLCQGIMTFDFNLVLSGERLSPVCKGKYIIFEVKLENEGPFYIPSEERIQVKVSIFSADNPPKLINKNMNGQDMIKGSSTAMLTYNTKLKAHSAIFKIQLNEVTSHFMSGWVFLVVEIQQPSEFLEQIGKQVKPLIVKNLIIKAKEATCKRWRETGVKKAKAEVSLEDEV